MQNTKYQAINLYESVKKVNLLGLGYNIYLNKLPFIVANPVLIARPVTGFPPIFLVAFIWVPANKVYFLSY